MVAPLTGREPRPARTRLARAGLALLLLLQAAVAAADPPAVAVIIDDLGDRLESGRRALALPGPVTYSFLPHTPYAERLARRAHDMGKEVMLHLPMEAVAGNRLGPGGLTLDMTRADLAHTLRHDLASVPYARGINNHMGSLLTRHPGHMGWLMGELAANEGMFFVDSRTTPKSIAVQVAAEHHVPYASRDIFLDHYREPGFMRGQFAKLLREARAQGTAIGIAHPYPESLRLLARLLPRLEAQGIRLLPASEVVRIANQRRKLWQASLSPSPKGAKSSKR